MNNPIFTEADIISVYTRAEAIADGVLIDLTANYPLTKRLYKFPVACTQAVWAVIESTGHENLFGIVLAVLVASQKNIVEVVDEATRLFEVVLEGAAPTEHCKFKIMCHGGDDCEPVLTVLLPHED